VIIIKVKKILAETRQTSPDLIKTGLKLQGFVRMLIGAVLEKKNREMKRKVLE